MPTLPKGYSKERFLEKVTLTVYRMGMLQRGDSVLVGLSGGPDSVALLTVLCALAPELDLGIGAAHLNHHLRGDESDRDARFSADLAERLDIPFYAESADVERYRRSRRVSPEEAARDIRLTFLERTARTHGFDRIALGHHADDNAEQILMRVLRGSGPRGLAGIPPVRGRIIRPLIRTPRSEIIAFLSDGGTDYVSDSSNADPRYLRNRVRHELLPLIRETVNPRVSEALNRLSSIIRCEQEWMAQVTEPVFREALASAPGKNAVALSVPLLVGLPIAARRWVVRHAIETIKGDLRRISHTHVEAALRLIEKGPTNGLLHLPDRIRIERSYDILTLRRADLAGRSKPGAVAGSGPPLFEYCLPAPGSVRIEELGLLLELSAVSPGDLPEWALAGHRVAFFDMDKVQFPITVRTIRPGDRFTPLGMTGSQKLKKFFINNKVPRSDRYRCPILVSRQGIIWVAGLRIDRAVRVGASTRTVLKAELRGCPNTDDA